jgi:hypothetical protein
MSSPETFSQQHIETERPYDYLGKLISVVEERDPEVLKTRLREELQDKPQVDMEFLEKVIAFNDEILAGLVRIHDIPPEGQPKKPFTTHTIGTALLVAYLLGDEVTTETLAIALSHDAIEDGKIDRGLVMERNVTVEDLETRFGGERGEVIAWGVNALSRVRDIPTTEGGVERVKLSRTEYAAKLKQAETERPLLGIYNIKYGADKPYNTIDPIRQLEEPPAPEGTTVSVKKDPWTSRRKTIDENREHILPRLEDHPHLQLILSSATDVAEQTMRPRFDRDAWKQIMPKRTNAA